MESIAKYFSMIKTIIDEVPFEAIEAVVCLLQDARLQGHQIFVMGNGGSAATASHIAADLAKNTRVEGWPHFKVIGLTDNLPIFSAYANDEGYETVFAEQLNSLLNPDDVVIGISGSGNSPNVLNAIKLANHRYAKTVGFTGLTGGQLKSLAHVSVHVPTDRMDQAEDFHMLIAHSIISYLAEDAKSINAIVDQGEVVAPVNNGHADGLVQNLFGKSLKLQSPGPMAQKPVVPTPEILSRINEEFASKVGLHNLLSRLLNLIVTYMGASSGSIVVLDEKGEVADGASAYGGTVSAKPAELFSEIVHNGLAGWVVENRRPAIVENTQEDPRWLRRVWETSRCAICIPLMTRDRVIGVLTLNRLQTQPFNMEDLSLLTAVTMSLSYSFNAEYTLDDKLNIL